MDLVLHFNANTTIWISPCRWKKLADGLGGKLAFSPLRSGDSLQIAQFLRCKKTSKAKTQRVRALKNWLLRKFYISAGC